MKSCPCCSACCPVDSTFVGCTDGGYLSLQHNSCDVATRSRKLEIDANQCVFLSGVVRATEQITQLKHSNWTGRTKQSSNSNSSDKAAETNRESNNELERVVWGVEIYNSDGGGGGAVGLLPP